MIHHHVTRGTCTGRTVLPHTSLCYSCWHTLSRRLCDRDLTTVMDDQTQWWTARL